MAKIPTPVSVTEEDRRILESWIRGAKTEQRLVLRAKIILAAASGQGTNLIARELDVRPATVSKCGLGLHLLAWTVCGTPPALSHTGLR